MRVLRLLAGVLVIPSLAGCHSAYIEAVVKNRTDQPVSLVEVDYPSASFGTQTLAPGADFKYRFKVLGSGATKVLWTDSAHHDHSMAGPELKEGDEGLLQVTLAPGGPVWVKTLKVK